MVFSEIEFQEKTRLKRAKETSERLPILVTEKITMEYGKKVDKTRSYIKRDEKIFIYLGKKVMSGFSLGEIYDGRFPITWVDLVSPQDLLDLQDEDFQAFGVFLPKKIILEVLDFHKNHNDEFSLLVKKYPFSPIIFSQWLTIKLYDKHKELTKDSTLTYKDFMQTNFSFSYNGKTYDIYKAIALMQVKEFNNKDDEFYSLVSSLIVGNDTTPLTLYDFLYDIIPNSIKRVFLKDRESMKAYLPLRQEEFFYELKENYTFNTLSLKGYTLNSTIPKAKSNQLGIAYDELWEMISKSEKDLEYPEIWEFKVVELPPDCFFFDDVDQACTFIYGVEPTTKHKANFEDIVRLSTDNYYRDAGFRVSQGIFDTRDKVEQMIAEQYYEANALLSQNNFHTTDILFETYRMKLKEEQFRKIVKEFRGGNIFSFNPFVNDDSPNNDFVLYGWAMWWEAKLIYRFNQALTLCFLNAYASEKA